MAPKNPIFSAQPTTRSFLPLKASSGGTQAGWMSPAMKPAFSSENTGKPSLEGRLVDTVPHSRSQSSRSTLPGLKPLVGSGSVTNEKSNLPATPMTAANRSGRRSAASTPPIAPIEMP